MASNIAIRLSRGLTVLADLPLYQLSLISFTTAVTSHITYFCHSERDLIAKQIFLVAIFAPLAVQSLFQFHLKLPFWSCVELTSTIYGSFLLGMWSSMVVYRIWFHPLRNFPGPFWAKVTKFWIPYTHWKTNWQYHLVMLELHKKYGDIVRIGPNDISINHADGLQALARAKKGTWYNFADGEHSLQSTRNSKTHAIRRRVWDKAFTTKAVQDYLPRVLKYTDTLMSHISKNAGSPINVTDWFNNFMLDIMGDLAFGKPFNYMKPEKRVGAFDFKAVMHDSAYVISALGQVSYSFTILSMLGAGGDVQRFLDFCTDLVGERKAYTPKERDIFSYILDAEPQNVGEHKLSLMGETRLIVVAASDTTSATLVAIFTLLGTHPHQLRKLRADIDAIYDAYPDERVPKEIINGGTPATRHLEATITEALRMSPAVANGVQRMTPNDGIVVDGVSVPGGVNAIYCFRAAHMDERWFPDAQEFKPERWYEADKETLARQRSAYAPFWLGAYECVGKPLANMQLRIVTSQLLRKFDISLAEENVDAWEMLNRSKDLFTTIMAPTNVIFTPRHV
ncbi:uncharacterized protein H6S33_000982 [Morchella sextelata]|uniref:uncharacterized protein n=1 Tax=Morchella sextelata TaxID=1174677 RepID=UPI001D048E15|nr:uncharacterized protein H6S33_000982 [Morchella sextelata]KAH0615346.1 hypothetical protein H6S33_000982 [Morchella sextelata]